MRLILLPFKIGATLNILEQHIVYWSIKYCKFADELLMLKYTKVAG